MKTVYVCDLPVNVQNAIEESYEYNKLGPVPKIMSIGDALTAYLHWEGIYGYTDTIISLFDTLDSELSEIECSSELRYTGAHYE